MATTKIIGLFSCNYSVSDHFPKVVPPVLAFLISAFFLCRDKNEQQPVTLSHFITGNGRHMVAYRRYDGTLIEVKPDVEE